MGKSDELLAQCKEYVEKTPEAVEFIAALVERLKISSWEEVKKALKKGNPTTKDEMLAELDAYQRCIRLLEETIDPDEKERYQDATRRFGS